MDGFSLFFVSITLSLISREDYRHRASRLGVGATRRSSTHLLFLCNVPKQGGGYRKDVR